MDKQHIPDNSSLVAILHESDYNWFQLIERVEDLMKDSSDLDIPSALENFFLQIPHLGFGQRQLEPVVLSHLL